MTLHEYAKMKNSEEGLRSQISQEKLHQAANEEGSVGKAPSIADNLFFARLKPDSAQQVEGDLYIGGSGGGNDDRRIFARNQSHQVDFSSISFNEN